MHPHRSLVALGAALLTVLLAALLVVLAGPSTALAEKRKGHQPVGDKRKRPNVVMIMSDDQDFRSMWAMPQTRELIGSTGTTFQHEAVTLPLCCPSRATFLTGQYPHNNGIQWNAAPGGGYYKLDGSETLPVWLQRAGYRTVHIGKYLNEYGEKDPTEVPQGWSEWYGGVDPTTYDYYNYTLNHDGKLRTYGESPRDYSTDVIGRIASHQIKKSSQGNKPFFLNVAPIAPHTVAAGNGATKEGTPAVPAPRDADVFANTPLPPWPNFNEADLSDKPALLPYFPKPLGADAIDSLTDHYDGRMGAVLGIDDLVARVEDSLHQAHVARNTVVIYTSDNGWILGEHRLSDTDTTNRRAGGVKFLPYEASSRVPLMISGPGFPAGRKVKSPTVNADLTSTILDVADAKPGLPQDGISLRGVAQHPKRTADRGVLTEAFANPRLVPPYKSIHTKRYRWDQTEVGFTGLIDLKLDPWELQSVHDDPRYTEVKKALQAGLAQLRDCAGASCRDVRVDPPEPTGKPLDPH